ncbi:hypothetical protein ACOT81_17735 [Streptomyces sp. WI04-05B]|uniref:hypothetical protein n=1 Tax=Streptomyces TaxID=1883 RepID=UPI0029AAA737|nr:MULTISPECIES: hypothetical protein [unclassified Streptomyces]MDX2543698.1 hypothetical protein [Streptomyces sp. WI04-05B]MDX2582212.1 hypothetical protein [Streptomyces sp. WI04-05A]MDX3747615.1 hypothetical protein [Streptomyces sp. AK08-02]
MNPESYVAPHTLHAADLRAEADAHRLALAAKRPPRDLRTRIGWTLVEVGLRLTSTPPKPQLA